MSSPSERLPLRDVSVLALVKIAAAVALTYLVVRTFDIFLLVLLGLLLAVSLDPLVARVPLERRKAVGVVALAFVAAAALFGVYFLPAVYAQAMNLIQGFPDFRQSIVEQIPGSRDFRHTVSRFLTNPRIPDVQVLMAHSLRVLNQVLKGLAQFFLVGIFAFYLLLDGRRAFKWVADFFSAPVKLKLQTTATETSKVIQAFARGQLFLCVCSFLASWAILKAAGVPGALLLATLAGVLDIIPVVGFITALIPAVLLGFTVSSGTGLWVLGAYLVYHFFEVYVTAPRVYGRSLKVSSLVILLGLLVAGSIGGVLCAIVVLPMLASYPIIERIWLAKYLGPRVVSQHAEATETIQIPEQVRVWSEGIEAAGRPVVSPIDEASRPKILVVEDDLDISDMLTEILGNEGYRVLRADNGKRGLELLFDHPDVGLVLLDRMMPVMDGPAFLAALRSSPDFARLPVIFLTAAEDTETIVGAAGYLRKPTRLETVIEVIQKHFQDRRSPVGQSAVC